MSGLLFCFGTITPSECVKIPGFILFSLLMGYNSLSFFLAVTQHTEMKELLTPTTAWS